MSKLENLVTDEPTRRTGDVEVIEVDDFDFDGFQVVRGEFFAHIYEPSFTFNGNKVSVNTACIRKLPETEYVQILVNKDEKKLAVRPCGEDVKDSVRWCSATSKRSPKQITCRVFFAKVIDLMGWNPDWRYKLVGKLLHSKRDYLFVFDLSTPEIFQRTIEDDGKTKTSRRPSYPEEWKTQFGVPVTEHQSYIQMNIFDGESIIRIEDSDTKRTPGRKAKSESEEPNNEQIAQPPAGSVS